MTEQEKTREQLLAELKESKEKYLAFIDDSAYGYIEADLEGFTTFINKRGLELSGYEKGVRLHFSDLITEQDLPRAIEDLQKVYQEKNDGPREYHFRRKDGEIRVAEINTLPLKRDGQYIGFQCTVLDVSNRRQAEEERDQIAQHWQATFDSTQDAILILDQNQRIVRSNNAAQSLSDTPSEEVIGKFCWEVIHPTIKEIAKCPLRRARKSLSRESLELKLGEAWFKVNIDPIINSDGECTGFVHVANDITELKLSQKKLEEAYNDLKNLDELKNNFLANISHELKTPLVSIKGYLELALSRNPERDILNKWLGIANSNITRLEQIIKDLLDISSISSGAAMYEFAEVDIEPLIQQCVERLKVKLTEKNLWLEFNCENGLPAVWADRKRIESVVINLLYNAIKYSEPDTRIKISVDKKDSSYISAKIEDEGIGIAEEFHEKIFTKFFQVDSSTTRKYSGSGIGLALVKEIISAHQGDVWVESELDKGSCFFFTLPIPSE